MRPLDGMEIPVWYIRRCRAHALKLSLSAGELLDHRTGILLRNVHIGQLHGSSFLFLSSYFIDHLCLADRKLEALPAHVLNEDGQMQLAAAGKP